MVVGFNHNFSYKGVVYHIQTEDGGRNSPSIVTLLYRGGTILASRKTSYADIIRVNNLALVVEELMKEQHRGMLRGLKNGEFDDAINRFEEGKAQAKLSVAPPALPTTAPANSSVPQPTPVAPTPEQSTVPATAPQPVPPLDGSTVTSDNKPVAAGDASLDEIILSYLLGEGK